MQQRIVSVVPGKVMSQYKSCSHSILLLIKQCKENPLFFTVAIPTEQHFCLCREVVTFNHFLEEAAEKEVRGKVRLQHFIENLLQRVDLAEKQLEYYQNQQIMSNYSNVNEHVVSKKKKGI